MNLVFLLSETLLKGFYDLCGALSLFIAGYSCALLLYCPFVLCGLKGLSIIITLTAET